MNFNNLSPRQIAAFNAASISLAVSAATLAFLQSWLIAGLTLVILFSISYGLIFYSFQHFINRRIKLIYKLIFQTKANRKEEMYYKYILPKKSIDEVSEDVANWAVQKSKEIEILERNEAYRKEFLQNLAHEFKTPIFAIQGYVDTLLDGAMENPDIRKRFLENTQKNVDRLVNLMNDLDEISRLERGEQSLAR
jgi:two-component system phosphate regulon sensor histidine kinase PhoR